MRDSTSETRMPIKKRLFLLAFGLLLSAFPALAEEYNGKVVGITDGDILTLLTAEKRQVKVRLAEIDTPERNQPYGSRARQALSDLAFNREARVVVVDHDRYGRVVGPVYVDDTDVNGELIRQGAACGSAWKNGFFEVLCAWRLNGFSCC